MILSKIISTSIEKSRLIVKILGLGAKDVKTVYNLLPFGLDSRPVKGMRGIYTDTSIKGEKFLAGILFEDVSVNEGEVKLYSLNSSGVEQFYILLTNDGNCELGGNTDNLLRYSELNSSLQNQKDDINAELTKIQTSIISLGGTYSKSNITLDIEAAKIENLKTN